MYGNFRVQVTRKGDVGRVNSGRTQLVESYIGICHFLQLHPVCCECRMLIEIGGKEKKGSVACTLHYLQSVCIEEKL